MHAHILSVSVIGRGIYTNTYRRKMSVYLFRSHLGNAKVIVDLISISDIHTDQLQCFFVMGYDLFH